MILSMTGFAAASAELPGASLAAELRSVNHRYLDLSLKLSDELRTLEPALRDKLAGSLRRGKVELRLGVARTSPGAARLAVDADRVASLAAAAADVERQLPRASPLSVHEILRWPGVLAEPSVDAETLAARALALVDTVLSSSPPPAPARARSSPPSCRRASTTSVRRSSASRRAFRPRTSRTPRSSTRACAKRASTPTRTG